MTLEDQRTALTLLGKVVRSAAVWGEERANGTQAKMWESMLMNAVGDLTSLIRGRTAVADDFEIVFKFEQ